MHYLLIKPLKFNIRLHFCILRIWVFQRLFELQSANNKWKAAAREPNTHHLAITICHKIRDPNGSQPKWYHKSILLSYHALCWFSYKIDMSCDIHLFVAFWCSYKPPMFSHFLSNLQANSEPPKPKDETVNLYEMLTIKPPSPAKQTACSMSTNKNQSKCGSEEYNTHQCMEKNYQVIQSEILIP